MATPRSPPIGARKFSRNISHPLPRRSTKGPLDDEDPLAEPKLSSPVTPPVQPAGSILAIEDEAPVAALSQSAPLEASDGKYPDLTFLQDRRLYHKVPYDDIPQSFLRSTQQPALETPLSELLQDGHFRRAAETALNNLLSCPLSEPARLLHLLYCRLACLVLIARHDLAADEAVTLYDYFASSSPDLLDVLPYIPWELRVLVVRLQTFSAQDGGRRGIMSIYALASEVRANMRKTDDSAAKQMWSNRLGDLGLRVADALVEIGELESACRHLESLQNGDEGEIAARKTLLHIQTGNLADARASVGKVKEQRARVLLETLVETAEQGTEQILTAWHKLSEHDSADQLAVQNEAVFLLYSGRITEARTMLERTLRTMPANSTLLFNLSTIHELCSAKAMQHKMQIAAQLADKLPSSSTGGWERSNDELKL